MALVRRRLLEGIASRRVISVGLGLFASLLLLFLDQYPAVEKQFGEIELATYDFRMRTRPTHRLSEDIQLVGLTDYDLDYYHEPLRTRQTHAEMQEVLQSLGVRSVMWDILFIDELDNDSIFSLYMQMVPTFIPYHFYLTGQYPDFDVFRARWNWIRDNWRLPFSGNMVPLRNPIRTAIFLKLPTPELIDGATSMGGLGHINVETDSDGVVRRIPLLIRLHTDELGDCLYPSISLQLVLHQLGLTMSDLDVRFGEFIEFTSGDPPVTTRIPIDEQGRMMINFREGRTFINRGLSLEVIANIRDQLNQWLEQPASSRQPLDHFEHSGRTIPRDFFEGKTILLGEVAVGSTDIHATAINRNLPMIAVHANVIDSILNRDFVTELPPWVEQVVTLFLGLLAGFTFGRLGYLRSAVIGAVVVLLYLAVSWVAMWKWSLWIPTSMPLMALTLAGILILVYHLVTEEKRQQMIRTAFEAYTSPEVVQEILKNIDDPALWGARRRVTTLFVDIRGFTTLTEKVPPEIIVEILNDYYEVAVVAIQHHGGIPNKFIGDEIMALFNAPRALEHPEEAACRAAIDIQVAVARLSLERLKPRHGHEITCGIGINTGEVIVGIVGRQKIEYTALGDDVNIASRLQGRARPGQILIGQSTYEALQRSAVEFLHTAIGHVRLIPEIILKGLTRRFDVYEIQPRTDDDDQP